VVSKWAVLGFLVHVIFAQLFRRMLPLLFAASTLVSGVPVNESLLPYGIDNNDCSQESCIIRNLPPVDKSAMVQFVKENPELWTTNSIHALDKTKNRGQIWLRLTNNQGDKQYEFPLWAQLKDIIMPMLAPYVKEECQLLRVSFSFIDPARHPRHIVPHSDTGKWALYSHRIHHPLQGSPTYFYWTHREVGNHSIEVSQLNRYEWNNIQRHSVTYHGDGPRVHLISDTLDECPQPALSPIFVAQPTLCKYVSGDLTCRKEGEVVVDNDPELAYGEELTVNPITGRKQKKKKGGRKKGGKKGGKKGKKGKAEEVVEGAEGQEEGAKEEGEVPKTDL